MAGLDPAIQGNRHRQRSGTLDGRVEPGHGERFLVKQITPAVLAHAAVFVLVACGDELGTQTRLIAQLEGQAGLGIQRWRQNPRLMHTRAMRQRFPASPRHRNSAHPRTARSPLSAACGRASAPGAGRSGTNRRRFATCNGQSRSWVQGAATCAPASISAARAAADAGKAMRRAGLDQRQRAARPLCHRSRAAEAAWSCGNSAST